MDTQEHTGTVVIGPDNPRLEANEAFDRMRNRLRNSTANPNPLIVYDLDGTLFDNRPRVIQILADLVNHPEAKKFSPELLQTVASVSRDRMHYLLKDTFFDYGIEDKEVVDWFQSGWFDRFFTDQYVVFDDPTDGAVKFVRGLQEEGAHTVYLTGRDTPGMRKGTLESLEKHGFPMPDEETCHLITKPTFEQADPDFKRDAIDIIRGLGHVVGVFDNEPKPMNVIVRAFPDAEHFFLDTLHSPDIEPLEPGIAVLKDFRV